MSTINIRVIDPDAIDSDAIAAVTEPTLTPHVRRENFDPTNEEHLASFKHFIVTGNWGNVQFLAELPFIEVPMTVLMKFAGHHLGAKRESAKEASARFSARVASGTMVPMPRSKTRAERIKETQARIDAANALLASELGA